MAFSISLYFKLDTSSKWFYLRFLSDRAKHIEPAHSAAEPVELMNRYSIRTDTEVPHLTVGS